VVGRRLPFRRASSSRLGGDVRGGASAADHVLGEGSTQEQSVGVTR